MLYRHGILTSVWSIHSDYALNYLPLIGSWLKGESVKQSSARDEALDPEKFGCRLIPVSSTPYNISEYARYSGRPEDAPVDSIAIIDICGAITKYDQECGPAGMVTKSNLLQRCYANNNIVGVLLNIDSGGGEVGAMRLMSETIASRNKPVIGFANDFAASAAAGILTSCDLAIANSNLCRIGSFGTYTTIVDYREYYAKMGVKIEEIYATASKDKNGEFYAALNGDPEPLRKMVNTFNESFLSQVENSRSGKLADRSVWGTGKMFFAEEAKQHGIIDAIDKFENVLNYFNTL